MPGPLTLISVPNVSEGRDSTVLAAIGDAFAASGAARLLDIHTDADHNRSVFTLAGEQGSLAAALADGAIEAVQRIDLRDHEGVHPHVGALDVAPIVFLDADARGAAAAEALVLAEELAERAGLPVFLYGILAGGRTRAELRRGGLSELTGRMEQGELTPDFGPRTPHPTAGVTLVAARPPLVAFNLELEAPATLQTARDVAERVREGGPDGLPGLRALGLPLPTRGAVQVSFNVEDHLATPLASVVEAVRAHVAVSRAELVGLAPRAAFEGFPEDVPIPGFDPQKHLIENHLGL